MLVALMGFYVVDSVQNYGVIHAGVRVGEVEVGHLDVSEATTIIEAKLTETVDSAPVTIYSSVAAAAESDLNERPGAGSENTNPPEDAGSSDAGVGDTAAGDEGASVPDSNIRMPATDETELGQEADSWIVTSAAFETEIDGAALAEAAYGVGRGGDFILGRPLASFFGVAIEPRLEFSPHKVQSIREAISNSTGMPMQNAGISFDGAEFQAHDGRDGMVVDEAQFIQLLHRAFLSDDREFIAPMVEQEMHIKFEQAEQQAAYMQQAIQEPVSIIYGENNWTLEPGQLGALSSAVPEKLTDAWELVPRIDAALLEQMITDNYGHIEHSMAPVNASYAEVDNELQIVPGQNGTGADFSRLAEDLEALLFAPKQTPADEETAPRQLQLFEGDVEPAFTEADAALYDFSQIISQYSINYEGIAPGSATNLENAARLINSSIIAPHSVWSLTGIVQEYTEENGFVMGQIIVGDSYQDGMGGGVCNIATTVFNTIYEAGYPIVERKYHTLRSDRYPRGRDAAIAYPYHDLKFENDTDNYILLTMSYDGIEVTCTLWGVPPGYTVESVPGELIEGGEYQTREIVDESLQPGQRVIEQQGMRGSKISVTRYVYDAAGNLREERTFHSTYDATAEIVRVGPTV